MVRFDREKFLKLKKRIEKELVDGDFFNGDKFYFLSLIFVILLMLGFLRKCLTNYYLLWDWNLDGFTLDLKHKFWYWTTNEKFPQVEIFSPWYTNVLRALTFEKLFYKNPFETLYDAIKGIPWTKQNWLTNLYIYKLFCEIMLCIQFGYLAIRYNAATSYLICFINYSAFKFWLNQLFREVFNTSLPYFDDTFNYSYSEHRNNHAGMRRRMLPSPDTTWHRGRGGSRFLSDALDYLEEGNDESVLDEADYLSYDKEIIFHGTTLKDGGVPGAGGPFWERAETNSPFKVGLGKFPIFEDHYKLLESNTLLVPHSRVAGFSVWNKHKEELMRNTEDLVGVSIEDDMFESLHDFDAFPYMYSEGNMAYTNPVLICESFWDKSKTIFEEVFVQLRAVVKDDHIEYINFYRDPLSLALTSTGLYKQDNLIGLGHFVSYEIILKGCFGIVNYMLVNYFNMYAFMSFNRRLKDFMPYLIRWHWTTQFLVTMLYTQIFAPLASTLESYAYSEYQVYVEELVLKKDPDAPLHMLLYAYFDTILNGLHTIYIPLCMFAGLHAIFGQYFYLAGITSHVELHIGRREDNNSVFGGGSMDWQKYAYADRKFMWYGMLGRGRDKRFILFSFFDSIKNLLIKFFKKFILFLKRD